MSCTRCKGMSRKVQGHELHNVQGYEMHKVQGYELHKVQENEWHKDTLHKVDAFTSAPHVPLAPSYRHSQ